MSHFDVFRSKHGCSECLICNNRLLPLRVAFDTFLFGSDRIIFGTRMHIEMCWLDELVHEENRFWLLLAD